MERFVRYVDRIPSLLAATVMLFLIAACDTSPVTPRVATTAAPTISAAPTPLPGPAELSDGTVWVLEFLHDKPLVENTFITLSVKADRLGGSAGCNLYGGRSEGGAPIARAGGAFSTPPIARTVMGCAPAAIIDQERAYLKALRKAKKFRVFGDRLDILDNAGDATLVFTKQEALPGNPIELAGTQWRLLPEGDWEEDGPAVTLVFLDDYRAAGVAACRDYFATYGASEGRIGFPGMSMVRSSYPSCSDEIRRLEGRFTTDLSRASDYSVYKDAGSSRLMIRTWRGKTLTFEPLVPAVESIAQGNWVLKAFVQVRVTESGTRHLRVTNPLQGPEITMSFREGGVSGSAGCNSYSAQHSIGDEEITFTSPGVTRRACANPEGVMQQETRFLDLLPNLTKFHIYGDRLFIFTGEGSAVLFADE